MFNNQLPIMSIENTTLVHFRHFSSLLNNEIRSTNSYVRNYKPFLTNKANFRKSQMNVSDLLIREYEQMDTWSSGKNKPNTKPIQSQYKANTKPIQSQYKPKTNPNKANSCPPSVWRDGVGKILYGGDLLKIYFLLKMNHPARY